MEAFFRNAILVLRVLRGKGRMEEIIFPKPFDTGRWYHIGISHRAGRALGSAEVVLFRDGEVALQSHALRYPDVSGSDVLSHCCIASNPNSASMTAMMQQKGASGGAPEPLLSRLGLCGAHS